MNEILAFVGGFVFGYMVKWAFTQFENDEKTISIAQSQRIDQPLEETQTRN